MEVAPLVQPSLRMPGLTSNQAGKSARQIIMEAVDMLESENDDLKQVNVTIVEEMARLRRENEQLKQQLAAALHSNDEITSRKNEIEEENKYLKEDADSSRTKRMKTEEAISKLKSEHIKCNQDLEITRKQVSEKETHVKKLTQELVVMKSRVEESRAKTTDRDIELLHSLERLKEDKKSLEAEKDRINKLNGNMKTEIKQLESQADSNSAELKNENRRHTLLAKEFNSLLEENNHLKLQLRRRRSIAGITGHNIEQEETTRKLISLDPPSSPASISRTPPDHGSPRPLFSRESRRSSLTNPLLGDSSKASSVRTLDPLVNLRVQSPAGFKRVASISNLPNESIDLGMPLTQRKNSFGSDPSLTGHHESRERSPKERDSNNWKRNQGENKDVKRLSKATKDGTGAPIVLSDPYFAGSPGMSRAWRP